MTEDKAKVPTRDQTELKQVLVPAIVLRIAFILSNISSHNVYLPIYDPNHSWGGLFAASIVRQWIVLAADVIGAICIFNLGKAVIKSEIEESKLEYQTSSNGKNDLLIPGVLRPERGWIFGLPSKIPREEGAGEFNETHGRAAHKRPILSIQQMPVIASALYLLNPVLALAAMKSLRSLWDMLLLISFYYAVHPILNVGTNSSKTGAKCAFFLSLAAYFDIAYGIFLVPILIWRGLCGNQSLEKSRHCDWKVVLILFSTYYCMLQLLSMYATKEGLMERVLPNLAFVELDESGSFYGPNIGLHWYFYVQMFDRFRPYFSVFISGIPATFVIPLTIRLYKYPSVLIAAFQLIWSIFCPNTSVHTLTLGLIFIVLNPRSMIRMRDSSLIALFALPVPVSLFATFHQMWLVTGNGNPNYLFFQCFAYGLFVAVILLDVVSATVKRDKVLRMAMKGNFAHSKDKEHEEQEEEEEEEEEDSCNSTANATAEVDSMEQPNVVFL